MEYFYVQGGSPLRGSTAVHGAKNSALPILAATLLAEGESVLHNCPNLTDISVSLDILSALGCRVRREGQTLFVDTTGREGVAVPNALMGKMRASVLFLGALLAKSGKAVASWPGGCALGARPIDWHLYAFRMLGAEVEEQDDLLSCEGRHLQGRRLRFSFPSVGATENAMLAACGAEGITQIVNAAREPEIEDLQGFLCALGAEVSGAGTDCITIRGGLPLRPAEYTVMPDRIVTATYLCAVGACGGEAELLHADARTVLPVIEALRRAGCHIVCEPGRIQMQRSAPLQGIGSIQTAPYPGFPTDAQPLLVAALAGGEGKSTVVETIFDHRFRYVEQLRRMGAAIITAENTAQVIGSPLCGATVEATDLRGGAALALAALGASGETSLYGLDHIDRGYTALEASLRALGGRIERKTRR